MTSRLGIAVSAAAITTIGAAPSARAQGGGPTPDSSGYVAANAPVLTTTVLPFLDGVSGAKSWADQVKERH